MSTKQEQVRGEGSLDRALWKLVLVGLAVLLAWPIAPIFTPLKITPQPSDVILVLGPATPTRLALADNMIEAGYSDFLLISAAEEGPGRSIPMTPMCSTPSNFRVYCKQSLPFTTQGEIGMLEALAQKNGWDSAIIVTDTAQVSRARLYAGRCFSGRAVVLSDGSPMSMADAAQEYVYQSAGFAKALLITTGCASN